MSNKFLLKKSSVAAKVPLTTDLDFGELALNYTDGLLYYKNSNNTVKSIGSGSSGSTFTTIDQKSYTATQGQTSFNVTYTAPYVNVYVNGSRLNAGDYTATSGTSVTLTVACTVGDEVELVGFTGTVLSLTGASSGQVVTATGTGSLQLTTLGTLSTQNSNSVTITGGSIDGTSIGATTASSGAFTTLTATGKITTKNSIDLSTSTTVISNDTVTQTSISSTTQTAIDTFSTSVYRSAKYVIQIAQGSSYQVSEILVLHDGTTTYNTEYGIITTGSSLATISTDISGVNVRLLITMASATAATINITRTAIVV